MPKSKPSHDDAPHGESPHGESPAGVHTITIQKIPFSYHAPYTEGYAISTAEASALNQLLGENLRNNFAAKVKTAKEAGLTPEVESTLRAEFATYASTYAFGSKRASGPRMPSDPIGTEAKKLARAKIVEHLQKNGHDPKNFKDVMEAKVAQLLERDPSFMEEARRRHEAVTVLASDVIESLMAA